MDKRWNETYRTSRDPRAVVSRHRGRLLDIDGVVSVGLGFGEGHRTVIVVGVTADGDVAPEAVPADLDGVPVSVVVVGAVKAGDGARDGAARDEGAGDEGEGGTTA